MCREKLPEELDLDSALRLVFPGFNPSAGKPPRRGWRTGERPRRSDNYPEASDRLAGLDAWIEKAGRLRDSRKTRSNTGSNDGSDELPVTPLLPIQQLEARGIACPYFFARLGIAYAADRAKAAAADHEHRSNVTRTSTNDQASYTTFADQQKQTSDRFLKEADNLDTLVLEHSSLILANLSNCSEKYGHSVSPKSFHVLVKEYQADLLVINAAAQRLRIIGMRIAEERGRYVRTGGGLPAIVSFSVAIGQVYKELTGRRPNAKSQALKVFMTDAYTALGGNRNKWGAAKTGAAAEPPPDLIDSERGIVPLRDLLTCEVASVTGLDHAHASLIQRALDFEEDDPGPALLALCDTKMLPPAISALIRRIPWSTDAIAASILGLSLEEADAGLTALRERGVLD